MGCFGMTWDRGWIPASAGMTVVWRLRPSLMTGGRFLEEEADEGGGEAKKEQEAENVRDCSHEDG